MSNRFLIQRKKRAFKCSRCGRKHNRANQRYCVTCHAAYMRNWRKTHPLTEDQRFKDNVRSYAGTYKRHGRLKVRPCKVCGAKAEMHHPDYSKPLNVQWLCRSHHLELHRKIQNDTRVSNQLMAAE